MSFFVMGEGKSLGKHSSLSGSQWQFVLAVPFTPASVLGDYHLCCCSFNL